MTSCLDQTSKRMRIAILAFAAAGLAYGQHHPKISAELEGRDPKATVNVIIQYRQGAQQRHVDAVSRKGGVHKSNLDVVNGAAYSVPAGALEELANDPEVEFISPDHKLAATDWGGGDSWDSTVSTPDYGWMSLLGLTSPNAEAAYDGTGIGVAVIDSGIYSRRRLAERS